MSSVAFRSATKTYHGAPALNELDLEIESESLTVLCGPPKSGKSVLFRVLVGLEKLDRGKIEVDGQDIAVLPPAMRPIGYVPQSFALFPHLTVYDNIAYPLKLARVARGEIARRVDRAAGILSIGHLLKKTPDQLSGGEKQRTAVARGLLKNAKLFVLDDPLVGLDYKLRERLMDELKDLRAELKATFLYATSDSLEALTMAQKLVVLDRGRVVQHGDADEVYHQPQHLRSLELIGFPQANILQGVSDGKTIEAGPLRFDWASERACGRRGGRLPTRGAEAGERTGRRGALPRHDRGESWRRICDPCRAGGRAHGDEFSRSRSGRPPPSTPKSRSASHRPTSCCSTLRAVGVCPIAPWRRRHDRDRRRSHHQELRLFHRPRQSLHPLRRRRGRLPAGSVRLRQDHADAHHRRPRNADAGRILFGGRDVTAHPTSRRNVGMVFQYPVMYPTLSVAENIALPLRQDRTVDAAERERRVAEMLDILDMRELADAFIEELDAGSRQKVAVGRAVARRSDIVLFDEPTTNVEVNAKLQLIRAFKTVVQRTRQTIVYVTHDQTEAMTLADRIALMRDGQHQPVWAAA